MSEIAMPAKCRVCGVTFYGPKVTMVGQNRSTAFFQKLVHHLQTAHKDEASQIAMGAMEFQGMMTMAYYMIDDPELVRMMDVSRWNVHQKTLSSRFSDQQIAEVVEKIIPDIYTLVSSGDTVELRKNLFGCFAALRDKLEEPGKYQLSQVDTTQLVTH